MSIGLRRFRNELSNDVTIEYYNSSSHYDRGHQCNESCPSATITIKSGGFFTFDYSEKNGEDILFELNRVGMKEVFD